MTLPETRPPMKVTLYFGHHKVGSTALQSFLFRNQAALARAGILYPGIESESLSYMLAQLLGVPDEGEKAPPAMNAREPHNALAFQMLAQGEGSFQERARRLGEETESDYVRQIVNFITAGSDRSFLTPGSI